MSDTIGKQENATPSSQLTTVWVVLHLTCGRILHVLVETATVPPVANCLHEHFEEGQLVFSRRVTAGLPLIS